MGRNNEIDKKLDEDLKNGKPFIIAGMAVLSCGFVFYNIQIALIIHIGMLILSEYYKRNSSYIKGYIWDRFTLTISFMALITASFLSIFIDAEISTLVLFIFSLITFGIVSRIPKLPKV